MAALVVLKSAVLALFASVALTEAAATTTTSATTETESAASEDPCMRRRNYATVTTIPYI